MEKPAIASDDQTMGTDLERGQTRGIQYADDVDGRRTRRASTSRSRSRRRDSMDSMSIRQARRSVDPALVLPPQYRTMSFNIEEGRRRSMRAETEKLKESKSSKSKKGAKAGDAKIEFNDIKYHKTPLDELVSQFSSSRGTGLTSSKAAELLKTVGPNQPTPPPSHWVRRTLGYLFGGFGAILFIAAILVFIAWKPLGEPNPAIANLALAIVLILVWVAQAAFSFYQDFSSSKVMESITGMLPDKCIVLRDGQQMNIDGTAVVPGDLLRITTGNKLPADVRLVEVSPDVRFDRSILTGETLPLLGSVESRDDNYLETANIGMAGTHCVSGSAWGLVVETGDRTVFGKIAKLTSAPKAGLTPLQKEILIFVGVIVCLMVTMILIVIIVWVAWLRKDHEGWITVPVLIVSCVSVAVAFIPEGLPIAVTASLTITANIMKNNKVLCKSLKTVETLGAVNVVCSDKTGTLTKNRMSVTDYIVAKKPNTAGKAAALYEDGKPLRELARIGAVCNAAEFDASTVSEPLESRKVNGDATDTAILRFTESITVVSSLRSAWRSIYQVTFNSKNKFAINVVRSKSEKEEGTVLMIKGAPDILLPRCSSYVDTNGFVEKMTDTDRHEMETIKDNWSSQGKRVILLAKKNLSDLVFDAQLQPREYENDIMGRATSELILVGLVAIVDPPRDEIPEVIQTLRTAGIRVFMVTGDFKLTATAIARECGIITQPNDKIDDVTNLAFEDDYLESAGIKEVSSCDTDRAHAIALSGADLDILSDSQWDKLCKYEEICFARNTPDHKLRIVKELQARELTVAMTGDGVNDAPSLKAADIGIAMGSGSDIAMEAADMVLLESFAAIVEAVKYGRVVYDNLKKTIAYLLPAGSFSEFWPVLTNVCFGLPQILSSFLMIIICCFTDCAAATAIAYEKPEADVLTRPPRNAKKDHLVDWKLIMQAYGFIGVAETLCSFAMAYWYCERQGLHFSTLWFGFGGLEPGRDQDWQTNVLNTASSIYFVNLVVMQWFSLFAIRTRRLSVLQHSINWYLPPAIVFALLIAILFLYVPKFHSVLGTAVVPVEYWFLPMAFGTIILLIDEARKFGVRRWPKGILAKVAW
nr:hypothetical protein B0A51_00848 [Rachicladosporium sp. CCFEE 5018]